MNPPRTSSAWLTASASAGASRRVGMNSLDQRIGAKTSWAIGGISRPFGLSGTIASMSATDTTPRLNRRNRASARPRLTQPLVRDNGELRRATWDEALGRAATGFQRVVDSHGPEAFGLFSCSKATNEMNYVAQRSPAR